MLLSDFHSYLSNISEYEYKIKLFCVVQIATQLKKYTSPSILRHCVLGREVSRNLARNVPYLQHQHQAMASQGAREKKVSNVD